MNDAVTPFRVELSDTATDDLRERLRRTRWPEPATGGGWSQGTPLAWVRELCRHWLEDYDFGAARERLCPATFGLKGWQSPPGNRRSLAEGAQMSNVAHLVGITSRQTVRLLVTAQCGWLGVVKR